ncbi:unnamed protein product [Prunus armeniaca]
MPHLLDLPIAPPSRFNDSRPTTTYPFCPVRFSAPANSSHLICSSLVQPSFQLRFILLLIARLVYSFFMSKIEKEEDLRKKNWSNQYENPQSAHQSGLILNQIQGDFNPWSGKIRVTLWGDTVKTSDVKALQASKLLKGLIMRTKVILQLHQSILESKSPERRRKNVSPLYGRASKT